MPDAEGKIVADIGNGPKPDRSAADEDFTGRAGNRRCPDGRGAGLGRTAKVI